MTFVFDAFASSGPAEWLAGAASGPNGSFVWPAGEAQCIGPNTDTSEEMTLSKSRKVCGSHFPDIAIVDDPRRNVTRANEVFEPFCRIRIFLIVIDCHAAPSQLALSPPARAAPRPMRHRFRMSTRTLDMPTAPRPPQTGGSPPPQPH